MAEKKRTLPIPELITGITVAIILIVFALPRFMDWTQESVIGNEVSALYQNLQMAKNTAIKTRHRVWVQFLGTSGYRIFEDINDNGALDTGEPARRFNLNPEIQFGINLEQPVENVWASGIVSHPIEFLGGKEKIYFKPNGKISSSGAIYLISKIEIGNGNADIRALKIMGANGKIAVMKISRGDSPPWK